jgi:hypothetical protein
MRCPRCKAESPTDTSFCGRCGAPLKESSGRELSFTRTTPPPAAGPAPGRIVAGNTAFSKNWAAAVWAWSSKPRTFSSGGP